MTTFLFWNLGRQENPRYVTAIAHEHNVDILLLAECIIPPAEILHALNEQSGEYDLASAAGDRFSIYTRFDAEMFPTVTLPQHSPRLGIRRLRLPGAVEILVVLAHGPDKRSMPKEQDREIFFTLLRLAIARAEMDAQHQRTILVGDLNADPFEPVVADARYLHGVMTRAIAKRKKRRISTDDYFFFYNPMWRFYGDDKPGPSGTHYFDKSSTYQLYWHLLDQVLVRPALLERFPDNELAILERAGATSLLTKQGFPRKKRTPSDHLPILFRLDLEERGDKHADGKPLA